jgi:hypothetical protein
MIVVKAAGGGKVRLDTTHLVWASKNKADGRD